MELRQLEAFATVARRASFTRAAEELHLTQPAVTRQIAALESELGVLLFDRLGKRIQLTSAGETLLGYAAHILRLTEESQEALAELAAGRAGRIAIGAASTLATYVLPALLTRFRQEYPGIELSLRTGLSARVRELVLSGVVDVGLVTTEGEPVESEGALQSESLGVYETVLTVPPGHALAARASATVAELAGEPLLAMTEGTNLRTYAEHVLADAGVAASVTMELDSVEAIKRMVEAGLGISLLPRVAVASEVAAGRLVALTLTGVPLPERHIVLLRRRDKHVTVPLLAFIGLATSRVVPQTHYP
ncbi:LysR substrate-binding domain-containing protein [Armatimonas sp.]|uniref:LysR substrate-binding domain-containing protein n=1 Tax=Armatimonas sp. TaxID=1872638 RepID=UPI00374FF41B